MQAQIQSALLNLFCGDALAMPVHWYYRPSDIIKAFPPLGIVNMEAAPEHHPSSIMQLHSTTTAGRTSASKQSAFKSPPKQVVGDIILKGREQHWGVPNRHYHHGLPAGENTLNAWCARWLMEYLLDAKQYKLNDWLEFYVERMTAEPAAHPDTYAESYHRGFFANRAKGLPLEKCGVVSHDTPSMGALVTLVPLALCMLPTHSLEEVQFTARQHVYATHPDDNLMLVVDACVALIAQLLSTPIVDKSQSLNEDAKTTTSPHRDILLEAAANGVPGTSLNALLEKADNRRVADNEVVGQRYSLACYIDDSWPSVCWLALRHGEDPARALRVNANLGGENAHRGAVLGALTGLISGQSDAVLVESLAGGAELVSLVDAFVGAFAVEN